MKKTSLKVLLLVAIFSAFLTLGLTACGKDRTPKAELAAPENVSFLLNLTEDGETEFTLKWDKVKNANNYKVLVGGENISCRKTSLDITEYVNAGRKTEIDVWAEDNEEEYKPSKPTPISVTPKKVSKNLKFTQVSGGYEIGSTSSIYDGDLVLPDTYLNKPVLEIADEGFKGENLENPAVYNTVRLPNALKIIGIYSFCDSNLKEISLPETVTKICDSAFSGCDKLTKVDFGNVKEIGHCAFSSTNITELFIPKSVTFIGDGCFGEGLKSVTFEEGSNLRECGEGVFWGSELTDFPENLPIIGSYMFDDVNGAPDFLEGEVIIPESVKILDKFAFWESKEITSLHIPSTVTEIKGGAFENLYGAFKNRVITIDENHPEYKIEDDVLYTKDGKTLVFYFPDNTRESFTVPSTVEVIDDYAFHQDTCLKEITIPYGVKTLGEYSLHMSNVLEELILPDSITEIKACSIPSVNHLKLSNGLTSLPNEAMRRSSFTYVEIPESVTHIEKEIFSVELLSGVILHKGLKSVCVGQEENPYGMFGTPLWRKATKHPNIYFKGTAKEWKEMEDAGVFGTNAFFVQHVEVDFAPIYFYSEEEPPKMAGGNYDNNYWHYDENGMPVIWEIEK